MTKTNNRKKFFFYSDHHLQFREVKWFRLKGIALVSGLLACSLALILLVNHLTNDFLGLSNNRMDLLTQENQILQDQLKSVSSRVHELETTLDGLSQQGNTLRLLADLPSLDEATKAGGTGGAVVDPLVNIADDRLSEILKNTTSSLQRLSGEIRVQQQNYSQIVDRINYNKEYFSAMPALKPMDGYYSTSQFGMRMHPILGIYKTHEGLDIVNDVGTPVYAAGDGVIEMSGASEGGYGIVIVIRHGYGFQTLYAHLSKILVREGQRVKRGDMIGKSGKTGLASGPHLHYEVRYNGVCQNPVNYFFNDVSPQDYRKQIASR